VLDGPARSVSSSHVWTGRLDDRARVSIDLLALVPLPGDGPKVMKEYDPPTVVLRRLTHGGILFLSGVTDMTHTTLDEQFPVIIQRITDTLADGGATWKDVAKASFLLHHEESLQVLKAKFSAAVEVPIPQVDYTFVGSRQGKRLEIEVTARPS
jgi:enamine deaminase RidA (YjgF/YER057c/UK114 family)